MRYPVFRELHSRRLLLRKIGMEDAQQYYRRLVSSGAVTKYMLFQPHQDISETYASLEKAMTRYAAGRYYHWGITLKESGELIGAIDLLRFDEEESSCSFAYMLGEEFWGQGYGTEAVRVVFDFGFREMEMQRIEADHMAENGASGAVMRKAGMVYQGTVPGKYEKNGKLHDAIVYAITRQQWMQ